MTKPLSKDDLIKHQQETIRREWLRRLREQPQRRCSGLARCAYPRGQYSGEPVLQVCAMALLGEIVHGPQWWCRAVNGGGELTEIGAKAGLDFMQVSKVVTMNDGGLCSRTGEIVRPHTYRQIATVIERWFPQ